MFYNWIRSVAELNINAIIGLEMLMVALAVFICTVAVTKVILPVLRAKKLGQNISGYVPEHATKQGTPTMGGICFIIATLLVMLVWIILEVFGVIGTLDKNKIVALA